MMNQTILVVALCRKKAAGVASGVANGNRQQATGNTASRSDASLRSAGGENLTARTERFVWTIVLALAVVVASLHCVAKYFAKQCCQMPIAKCQASPNTRPSLFVAKCV